MRRFKATPQKNLIGMLILFVFIPLFLLWYLVFFLDKKPDELTIAIIVCIVVLAAYLYLRYKKQIEALAVGGQGEPKQPAEEVSEETESSDEAVEEEAELEVIEQAKK